jgi:hypothetical protein
MDSARSLTFKRGSAARGEWTYLMFEVDRPCAVCEEYVHRGQAAGYVAGRLVHARCYREDGDWSGRPPAAA